MNMIASDDYFTVAVEGILPDITDREYMYVLESAYKTLKQGMAEDSLEEADRRGFLKGLGAAAVAGAAGSFAKGAKAQSVDYVQLANDAVKRANEIVTSYPSVMTGERRSYFANYTRENVYNSTIWYLNNTNGYNAEQVINYGIQSAKKECDGLKTGFGDLIGGGGLRDNLGTKVVNTFVQTYNAAITQKYNEVRQSSQQQTQQKNQTTSLTSEENTILHYALYVYYFTKNSPENENTFKLVSKEIGNFIAARNAKTIVNDAFRKLTDYLEKIKETDPNTYAGFNQWVKLNSQKAINDLNNLSQTNTKKMSLKVLSNMWRKVTMMITNVIHGVALVKVNLMVQVVVPVVEVA
jgi:hypothetical protein